MLGGLFMSVRDARLRDKDSREELLRAQSMLIEALRIIDENWSALELGARLQEVIDRLDAELN